MALFPFGEWNEKTWTPQYESMEFEPDTVFLVLLVVVMVVVALCMWTGDIGSIILLIEELNSRLGHLYFWTCWCQLFEIFKSCDSGIWMWASARFSLNLVESYWVWWYLEFKGEKEVNLSWRRKSKLEVDCILKSAVVVERS